MRVRPVLTVLVLALIPLAGGSGWPASAAGGTGRALFRLADPRLAEASGLAVGRRWPAVDYLLNDSGDSARFFAVDARTGRTRAVCRVPGARNVDWEDLATGPDQRGVASVWLADIGDNDAVREQVQLYRVDEPAPGASGELTTARPELWRLRYPDGPHDAESLIADPVRHRLYLITKSLFGRSEVFEVPAAADPNRVQSLVPVASISFGLTGTAGGPNPIGQLTATGASMSADGSLVVVRTYTDAYLWPVLGGDLAATLRRPPIRVPLPAQPQGEGIAFGAGGLLVDSEGVGSAVYQVPLPAIGRPSTAGSGTSPVPRQSVAPATTGPGAASPDHAYRIVLIAIVAAALAGAAGVARLAVGRRRRR